MKIIFTIVLLLIPVLTALFFFRLWCKDEPKRTAYRRSLRRSALQDKKRFANERRLRVYLIHTPECDLDEDLRVLRKDMFDQLGSYY